MTGEVPEGQLGQCLVGGEALRLWCALVHQGVGVLVAVQRPAADGSVELGVHQDIGEPKAAGDDTGAFERVRQLLASEEVPSLQRVDKQRFGLQKVGVVKLLPTVHVGIQRVDRGPVTWSIQRMSAGRTKCQVGRRT